MSIQDIIQDMRVQKMKNNLIRGQFSIIKADSLTMKANISEYMDCKFLIPSKYGGGYIETEYQNGLIYHEDVQYDVFELLAQWNQDLLEDTFEIAPDIDHTHLKPDDTDTYENRRLGLQLFLSDKIPTYPLKLVSPSCHSTYEDVDGMSLPNLTHNQDFLRRDSEEFKNLITGFIDYYGNNDNKEVIKALQDLPIPSLYEKPEVEDKEELGVALAKLVLSETQQL